MGKIRKPRKIKLIVGLLSNDIPAIEKAAALLKRVFGRTDFESDFLEFTHTDYYEGEMGKGLKRKFLSFAKPSSLDHICAVKLKANRLEKTFVRRGRRTVNIDPGYVDCSKLVLFSTKDYTHRIYLEKGIFAEVTLFYKGGTFNPWPWTYPDYKSAPYIDIFNSIRELYIQGTSAC